MSDQMLNKARTEAEAYKAELMKKASEEVDAACSSAG